MKTNHWKFPEKEKLIRIESLPDPFLKPDKTRVTKPEQWEEQRQYLKAMLSHYLYGNMPPAPENTEGKLLSVERVYDGEAISEMVRITFGPGVVFVCDITRPAVKEKVPVIVFNHYKQGLYNDKEKETAVKRGYAVAGFTAAELAPDSGNFLNGQLIRAYPEYDWGMIAAWSWGYSRIIDYLEQTDWADLDKIAVTGISRGGKTALCAGIYDERIAVCAPCCSGCGGTGNMRFTGGRMGRGIGICETTGRMVDSFPYWWCDEFAEYGYRQYHYKRSDMDGHIDLAECRKNYRDENAGKLGEEMLLPFDQHTMRALVAPRIVFSMDSVGDTWANPYGTAVSWRASEEVYRFLGAWGKNAMVFRDGPHGMLEEEWQMLVDFCDAVFRERKLPAEIICSNQHDMPEGLEMGRSVFPPLLHCEWERPQ